MTRSDDKPEPVTEPVHVLDPPAEPHDHPKSDYDKYLDSLREPPHKVLGVLTGQVPIGKGSVAMTPEEPEDEPEEDTSA